MTDETIVAVYDTLAHAEAAIVDLKAAGVPDSAISRHSESGGAAMSTTGVTTGAAPAREEGFWASLFGGEPDHNTAVYDRSIQSGSAVVSVKAPAGHLTRVMEILESHNPIDIDDRATSYGLTQTTSTMPLASAPATGYAATASATAADGGTIQLAEEQLAIGKRVVNRGGTRIRRFVVETPVEQEVRLRTEKVTLERRPVTDGRPVGDGSFSEKAIEMTETSEEAVVSKSTRVVEEVSLRKEANERVETVRDTVRREDVEVEQIPASTTTPGTTTTTGTTLDPRAPKI